MRLTEMLGVTEDYQVPDALLSCMLDDKRRRALLSQFDNADLSQDFFREYFETSQADRKSFMQDFTPECVCKIVAGIIGKTESVADVCSGTGALCTAVWGQNPTAYFRCEELSSAALPFTLFNLAVRNIRGEVIHRNTLTGETFGVYQLLPGEKYSDIAIEHQSNATPVMAVVSNPPYSLKWDTANDFSNDERFAFGLPPKSKADWAFVEHGYYNLAPGGTMAVILPHGVLFRGQAEKTIRENMLRANAIDAIIGLPENLFRNTAIPVVVMVLKKDRKSNDVLFIDASKDFEKLKNINNLTDEYVDAILTAYRECKDIDKYAHLVSLQEIEQNDFNLNLPRYVDTYEPPELPDIAKTMHEIREIHHEAMQTEGMLLSMMEDLQGETDELDEKLRYVLNDLRAYIDERQKMEEFECTAVELHVGPPAATRVADIADMERAKKDKIYPAGSTLIPMSAVNETDVPLYLDDSGYVDGRYAVISFRIPCIPKYMWNMVCSVFPRYIHRYATGLNLQEEALQHLEIPVHKLSDQMAILTELERQQKIIDQEEMLIEKWDAMKGTLTQLMFVDLEKHKHQ